VLQDCLDLFGHGAKAVHSHERPKDVGVEVPDDRPVRLPKPDAPTELAVRTPVEAGHGAVGPGDRESELPESLCTRGLSVSNGLAGKGLMAF
jgi:hypothetical protein